MADDDAQFKLRLPAELKERIESVARANNRSINAEILSRLNEIDIQRYTILDLRKRLEIAQSNRPTEEVSDLRSALALAEIEVAKEHARAEVFKDLFTVFLKATAETVGNSKPFMEAFNRALNESPTSIAIMKERGEEVISQSKPVEADGTDP
jgi:hypothetical protein